MNPQLIYVCSPLRATAERSMEDHLSDAFQYEAQVIAAGFLPVTPHLILTRHLDDTDPAERAKGIEAALRYLEHCDSLAAFGPRISQGMAGEIAYATVLGIPIVWYRTGEFKGPSHVIGLVELQELGIDASIVDRLQDVGQQIARLAQ